MSGLTADEAAEAAAVLEAEMGLTMGEKVGEGSYSVVHSAIARSGSKKAVKVIRPARIKAAYVREFIPRELEILGSIRHRNVVGMERTLRTPRLILVVGEFLSGGDLLAYIRRVKKLGEEEARGLVSQLVDAVAFLHAHDVVHRDIKCENVVLDGHVAKLCDLGFARRQTHADADSRTFCGSAAYAAPEVLSHLPYRGKPADMWSLGVVIYIAVTGFMPFDDRDQPKMLQRQLGHRIHFSRSAGLSEPVKKLVLCLLHPDPGRRPSANLAAVHDWLCPIFPAASDVSLASSATNLQSPQATRDLPLFN